MMKHKKIKQIQPEEIDSKIKVDELIYLCKDRGITLYSRKKKVDLINMLSN